MSVSASLQESSNGHSLRRLETRRRLLEAGTRVFAELGLHGATSAGIARRAGVATGTFYLHFADKHALFEEIAFSTLAELSARQERALAELEEGAETLRPMLEVLTEFAEEKRDLIRVAFDRGSESSEIAARIHDDTARRVEESLRRLAETQDLGIHPAAAAQARAATLIRVIAWWVEDPSRATREEIIETLYHLAPARMIARGAEAPSR